MQEDLQKVVSGVQCQSRPNRTLDQSTNTVQHSASATGGASRLSWIRSDDVTADDQSAAETGVDMLIDQYGRLDTSGAQAVDAQPRSDDVQQLIEVLQERLKNHRVEFRVEFRVTRSSTR